ncbi:MAG: hypothetical protein ACYTHM_20765 [Planctomycetota bacterium]|jgi:hypothetical protein
MKILPCIIYSLAIVFIAAAPLAFPKVLGKDIDLSLKFIILVVGLAWLHGFYLWYRKRKK